MTQILTLTYDLDFHLTRSPKVKYNLAGIYMIPYCCLLVTYGLIQLIYGIDSGNGRWIKPFNVTRGEMWWWSPHMCLPINLIVTYCLTRPPVRDIRPRNLRSFDILRLLKIKSNGALGLPICDFILMSNSNHMFISRRLAVLDNIPSLIIGPNFRPPPLPPTLTRGDFVKS